MRIQLFNYNVIYQLYLTHSRTTNEKIAFAPIINNQVELEEAQLHQDPSDEIKICLFEEFE